MKKIFSFVVMALAVSLAFTGCASKKAKDSKGPKTYRVDIGSVMSTIEVGPQEQLINVTSLLPDGVSPVAGDSIRVLWSAVADTDVDAIYVACKDLSADYILIRDVKEGENFFAAESVALDLDASGPIYVRIWSDTEAVCEVSYADAK